MTTKKGSVRPAGRRAELLERARHQRLEAYPASFGQRRLWLLDRLFPGSAVYNMPLALRLQGPLDPPAVAAALEAIARRHEPLRTALIAVDGEPMQVIRPPQRIPLAIVDLGGVAAARAGAAATEAAARQVARPFDLAAGRLLRALLIRLAADDHVLLLEVHHAASDEWSQGILVDELAELYRAAVDGRPSPLPALPARYRDFALWQRRWLEGEACLQALAFWRQRLGDLPPATEIAGDHPRPMRPSFRGERRSRPLPAALAARLRQAAGAERVTLFVFLLAAFEALLARLTGSADLVIGTPVANRHHLQTESLIGFFVNTLVLRTDLGGNPTLREAVARVRETVVAAIDHQDLPFERLVEELNPPRDLARSPLFQISFALQVARPPAGAGEPQAPQRLRVAPWELGRPTAKFDLSLFMSELGDDVLATVEWSRDLFDPATAERLMGRLEIVLSAMVASRETPLGELELLACGERHQLLGEWSEGGTAGAPPTLQERIEAWARETPEDPAVLCGEQLWTCGELNARANRLARHLRSSGVSRGDRVAVLLEREPEVVAALLAVLKAGACYLPLDPSYPAERLALLVADAGAKVVLTRPPFAGRPGNGAARVLNLDALQKAVARRSAADLRLPVDPLDLAYVIYTSGSTGHPKGVLVPHQALSAYLAWCLSRYGLSHGRGAPVHTSLGFDLTVTSLLAPLWARCPAILVPDALGLDGLRTLLAPAAELSVLKLTPAHLDVLGAWLGDGELEASIGCLVVGGEALHAATLAVWHAVAPATRVINEYGPTEATVGCSVHEVTAAEPPRDPVPIGRPIDGARLRVLDGNLQPVPIGVGGDLWIGGSGLARGYHNDPALTASSFRPDPFAERVGEVGARLYRSGDRARYLADGTLEFLGRTDEQLKVRGFRIEPAEVEAALTASPLVREAAVVGAHAAGGEAELVAWVVPAAPGPLPIARLRNDLAERLPSYMVPGHFEVAERLPLTAHGKVDRKALAAADRFATGGGEDLVRPRSLVQHQILEIWREVLGERAQGITDDFFEKGGTSLSAVRVLARMRRRFGLEVPLSAFFQARTVESLARWLREADPTGRSPLVEMQQGQGELPLCLVHPVGGAVLCYVPLLRHLGAQQAVLGFEAREDVPYDSFEEIAADYIDLLGAKVPRAPRLLFGWSFGGTLAYEMACQLARRGETPEMLVLLDSAAPRRDEPVEAALLEQTDIMDDPPAFLDALERALGLRLPITVEQLALVPRERQLATLLEAGRRIHVLPAEIEIEEVAQALANFRRLLALARAWHPRPYRGPMTLLRASAVESWVSAAGRQLREGDPTLGWGKLAPGTEVLFLPGTHASLVVEPDVGAVGRLLRTRIDEIVDRSRNRAGLVLEAAE